MTLSRKICRRITSDALNAPSHRFLFSGDGKAEFIECIFLRSVAYDLDKCKIAYDLSFCPCKFY